MNKTDKEIIKHLETVGPYTLDELVLPFGCGKFGVCRNASPKVAARVVREMPGRFTYQQAFDFCDYHLCDGCANVDVVIKALMPKTDCTADEWHELMLAFGSEKMAEQVFSYDEECLRVDQEAAELAALDAKKAARKAARQRVSLGDMLTGAVLGHMAYEHFSGKGKNVGRQSVFGDVPFQDFNNAWGSNDDHNWEADGDTQWDSHGDGLPGGDE